MLPDNWTRTEIGNIASFSSGNTPSKSKKQFWGGEYPWITAKDLKSHRLNSSIDGLTKGGFEVAKIAAENSTLLLVRGMTLLKKLPIGYATRDVAFNQDIKALVAKDDIDPQFLSYLLLANSKRIRNLVSTAGHGTGRLDSELIKSFPVLLPSSEEQTKIAQILSTWDEAITTVEKLIENSKQQKKALMQRLLIGNVRNPDFKKSKQLSSTPYGSIPADWRFVPIEQIAEEVSSRNSNEPITKVLSCSKHDGFVDSLTYFKKKVYSDDTSNYKVVKRGDFGFPSNHIEEGSIGYQNVCDLGVVSPIYTVFRTNSEVSDFYLYKLLKTEHYRQIFAAYTNASVDRRGSLRWKEFSKIKIPLPTLDEQEWIGEIIRIAESDEVNLKLQHSCLISQKKALMQQLLSGKKRVKIPEPTEG